jgi:ribosomal protein L7/L12
VDEIVLLERLRRLEEQVEYLSSRAGGAWHAGGGPPGTAAPTPSGIPMDVQVLVSQGKKIEAIKMYRELTGVGLAEAKLAVERL